MDETNAFILEVLRIGLYSWIALMAALTIVLVTSFLKTKDNSIIQKMFFDFDFAKHIAIILIVFAVSVLSLKDVIQGDAVIAILSGIAGYVLGGFRQEKRREAIEDDASP